MKKQSDFLRHLNRFKRFNINVTVEKEIDEISLTAYIKNKIYVFIFTETGKLISKKIN